MTASTVDRHPSDPSLPRRRDLDVYVVSRAVSWTGNAMTAVALPLLVFDLSGSPGLTGLLATAESLPYLLLGLPAGALVDRWRASRVMMTTSMASAALTGLVPALGAVGLLDGGAGAAPAVTLLAIAAGLAGLFVFFDAASFGCLPALAGRAGIGPATARLVSVSTVIGILAPPLAGLLCAAIGPTRVVGLDALTYLLGAVLLIRLRWDRAGVRPDASSPPSWLTEARAGLAHLWRTPLVRALTLLGVGNSLTGGAVTGLAVVMAVEALGQDRDGSGVGILFAAAALGTLITARALPGIQRRLGVGRITVGGLAAVAALAAGFAASPDLVVAALALLAWQAANSLVSLNGIVVRQSVTPAALQSRVNTTARMIAWGGQPLGAAAAGGLAELVGVRAAVAVAGSAALLACLAALAAGLWSVPRLADLEPSA